jgi:protein TonB
VIPPLDQTINETTQVSSEQSEGNDSDLPIGIPGGIEGGDKDSTGVGSFSGLAPAVNDEPQYIDVGVTEPVLIKRVEPGYPKAALISRIEGVVILEAIITKTGSVENLKTLRSDNAFLEKAAKEAVLQWKYKPAMLDGHPIKVYFTVTVTFHLR